MCRSVSMHPQPSCDCNLLRRNSTRNAQSLERMQDFVFENFYISSAYRNKIAFVLTPSLLVKVFAAASTIDAETMHVRIQSALIP